MHINKVCPTMIGIDIARYKCPSELKSSMMIDHCMLAMMVLT